MDPIKYVSAIYLLNSETVQHFPMNRSNHFFASLTNITNYDTEERVADMTTSLTVVTDGLENGTIITCLTVDRDMRVSSSSSSLYIAGLVSQPLMNHNVDSIPTQMCHTGSMRTSPTYHKRHISQLYCS